MVHAKSYETTSTFVEVLQEKLCPLFSGHGVHIILNTMNENNTSI